LNWFRFDIKIIVVLLILLSLPILSLNLQKPGENPWVLRPFSFAAGWIQESYVGFASGVTGTTRRYLDLVNINKENTKLKKENAELKAKLLNYDEISLENQRLNELLEFRTNDSLKLIPARVVGQDLFAERSTIRIGIGSKDGVKKGMAVIHPKGVVGYVLSANIGSSVVLLLTDRYAVIDARVQRSRSRGIVKGLNPTQAELVYLQRTDDVEIGDLVVSSGLDSIFPEGFPIAVVDNVHKESSGITQEVVLRPVVETSQLEEVFVVKKVYPQIPEAKEQAGKDKPTKPNTEG
jgi:rod shape-determining protein MreC